MTTEDAEPPTDLIAAEQAIELESSPPSVTVLVVGTDDWAIEQGAGVLAEAGLRVLRCHEPGEPAFPCNALRSGTVCPLDAGFDVIVTMRARPLSAPAQSELGVVCGLHAGARLVVAGMREGNPFDEWTAGSVGRAGDLPTAVDVCARQTEQDRELTSTAAITRRNMP